MKYTQICLLLIKNNIITALVATVHIILRHILLIYKITALLPVDRFLTQFQYCQNCSFEIFSIFRIGKIALKCIRDVRSECPDCCYDNQTNVDDHLFRQLHLHFLHAPYSDEKESFL